MVSSPHTFSHFTVVHPFTYSQWWLLEAAVGDRGEEKTWLQKEKPHPSQFMLINEPRNNCLQVSTSQTTTQQWQFSLIFTAHGKNGHFSSVHSFFFCWSPTLTSGPFRWLLRGRLYLKRSTSCLSPPRPFKIHSLTVEGIGHITSPPPHRIEALHLTLEGVQASGTSGLRRGVRLRLRDEGQRTTASCVLRSSAAFQTGGVFDDFSLFCVLTGKGDVQSLNPPQHLIFC